MSLASKHSASHKMALDKNSPLRIFVGRVPFRMTERELFDYFIQFGNILDVSLKFDKFK